MSAAWVALVLLIPSPRWVCWGTVRITPFRFPVSRRSNPVQEDAVAAESELRSAHGAQGQVDEIGARQGVTADVEAPHPLVADLAEARPEQASGNRRDRPVGDEVDLVHVPGVAIGGRRLEGAGREGVG